MFAMCLRDGISGVEYKILKPTYIEYINIYI
jgi:hypothetical protein